MTTSCNVRSASFDLAHPFAWEDAEETDTLAHEPIDGPTEADLDYYIEEILTGNHDQGEADYGDWAEATFDPDGWKVAQDRFERHLFGE